MPRIRDSSGPSQESRPVVSASSDTSGQGSPRARWRKAIRRRRAVAASVHGSTVSPSTRRPSRTAAVTSAGDGLAIVLEASSIAPSRVFSSATTRPSDQRTCSSSCHSAGAASSASSSLSGAAERTVASR